MIQRYMRKYLLEIVVFISGASVMILEIVASRILAPHVGTSIIVWTSLIGIILASLSLGYFWGGKIANRAPKYFLLRTLFFASSVYIFFVGLYGSDILEVVSQIRDVRVSSVLSALSLFSFPTILLGMVAPFSVQLKLKDLRSSGKVAGSLYAVSTVGSIMGTFWCGFYLLAQLGSRNILFLVSLLLVLCSLFANLLSERGRKLWFVILLVFALFILFLPKQKAVDTSVLLDVDTSYSRVIVKSAIEPATGRETIGLLKGRFLESYGYKDGEGMPGYYNYYDLTFHYRPGIEKVLMIGGAGYIYPRYFLERYPDKYMDVVEIDPALTSIAREYFSLKESPKLTSYHMDARNYIEETFSQYGAVLIDVFDSDITVPFQLASYEAVKRYAEITDGEGIVIMNVIGGLEGVEGRFTRAQYTTFRSVFPYVSLYPRNPSDLTRFQNIMLVASKKKLPDYLSEEERVNEMLSHRWEEEIENEEFLLTDDFAPVEQMMLSRGDWKYY